MAVLILALMPWSVALEASGEFGILGVTGIDGYMEMSSIFTEESRSRTNATVWDLTEFEFREGLRLDLDGYIYHPRLLTLQMGGLFEGVQHYYSGTSVDDDDDTNSQFSGDFSLTLLPEHSYKLNVRASRYEHDINPIFSRSYTTVNNSKGASFFLSKGPLPFTISYDQSEIQGDDTTSIDEKHDGIQFNGSYQLTERSRGTLRLRHSTDEELSRNRYIDTTQFMLNNSTTLGDEDQARLYGQLRWNEQSGTVNTSHFSLRERLNYRHTNRLSSQYTLQYKSTEYENNTIETSFANASVRHQLYESLASMAEVYVRHEAADYGDNDSNRLRVVENYTKSLGDWGRLNIVLSSFVETLERDYQEDTAPVFGERHKLFVGIPTELDQKNVLVDTIEVWRENRLHEYVLDEDYQIFELDGVVEIEALAGGDIQDGETVLVDYDYELDADGKILSTGNDIRAEIGWNDKGSIYVQYARYDQSLKEGSPDTPLNFSTQYTIGGIYHWRWLTNQLEFEERDSFYSPSTTWSDSITIKFPTWHEWQSQCSAKFTHTGYNDSDTERNLLNFRAHTRKQLSVYSNLGIQANYRRQRWDELNSASDMDVFDIRSTYKYQFRKLTVKVNTTFSIREHQSQTDEDARIDLRVRRAF